MKKKLLSVEDLVRFCQEHKLETFSAKESGYSLCVQVPATFAKYESDDKTLYAYIKLFHTGKNRNGSDVTQSAADHIMSTLAYKPLLANFTNVNGEWDFTSHDFVIVESDEEDGEDEIEYLERQIGCFTVDKPYMEYDSEHGHDYCYAKVAIPREYTKAAEIIERKDGTKVSVELDILEMAYSAKDHVLKFTDAVMDGCTCLGVDPETGDEIGEGMADAHISLQSFSAENNSMFTTELLEELKRFNDNFATINKESKEGGKEIVNKEKFEELLAKYEVSAEEVEFSYEELSDEELESKFAEVFGESDDPKTPEEDSNDDAVQAEEFEADTASEDEVEDESEDTPENFEEDVNVEEAENVSEDVTEDESEAEVEDVSNYSLTLPDGTVKTFSLSLDDIHVALMNLVNDTYGELDNEFYFVTVYPDDSKVVMNGYCNGGCYRQAYKRRNNDFSLTGERVPVHSIYVSDDEEKALNEAKANFEEVSSKLANYESEPEKLELINSEDYALIKNTEEYAEIAKRDNYFEMNLEDIKNKLDSTLLNFAKNQKFSENVDNATPKKSNFRAIPMIPASKKGKSARYGNMFSKNR